MSDVSELIVESKLKIDLEDSANRIEYEFADYLLPAPKGIYVINKVEPVMKDGLLYYIIEIDKAGNIKRIPVSDITDLNCCVYTSVNDCDKTVIPKIYMLKKEKYLGTSPVMAYRGIKILEGLINHQIDCFVKYRKSSKSDTYVIKSNLIKLDKSVLNKTISKIIDIYDDNISESIKNFLGLANWNLYFTKITDAKILIEKSIDWRAYQWALMEQKRLDKIKEDKFDGLDGCN